MQKAFEIYVHYTLICVHYTLVYVRYTLIYIYSHASIYIYIYSLPARQLARGLVAPTLVQKAFDASLRNLKLLSKIEVILEPETLNTQPSTLDHEDQILNP